MTASCDITTAVLKHVISISQKIGAINAMHLDRMTPLMQKHNLVRSVFSSLLMEDYKVDAATIHALSQNKRASGPEKDLIAARNTLKLYESLDSFSVSGEKSFLKAHSLLAESLIEAPGTYRREKTGGPPPADVPKIMRGLFRDLKVWEVPPLIKSCLFHYEVAVVKPFAVGNTTMALAWQKVILADAFPVFAHLPFEAAVELTDHDYKWALKLSESTGNTAPFMEYLLRALDYTLAQLLRQNNSPLTATERLAYFMQIGHKQFTRSDYRIVFKDISPPTASRDLKKGLEMGLFTKMGVLNKTVYRVKKNGRG